MNTKKELLSFFEEHKGKYFSGEQLASMLNISRAAVWKGVNSLRKDGYLINAVTNKGYCLSVKNDIISSSGIIKYLDKDNDFDIIVLDSTDSTNTLLRRKAAEGAPEGSIIVANEQTKGRGRTGKSFFSPFGTGIYLSILLRPGNCPASQSVKITTIAAVAICEAIKHTAPDIEPEIKWVNDIFINGKKVCGILTEASFDLESGYPEYIVLGLGINVYEPDGGFPEELKNIAGYVFSSPQNDVKNQLCAAFINCFMKYYRSLESGNYIEEYRKRSLVIGKKIRVISKNGETEATALSIDDNCHLIVEYENGKKVELSYGEIAVKL